MPSLTRGLQLFIDTEPPSGLIFTEQRDVRGTARKDHPPTLLPPALFTTGLPSSHLYSDVLCDRRYSILLAPFWPLTSMFSLPGSTRSASLTRFRRQHLRASFTVRLEWRLLRGRMMPRRRKTTLSGFLTLSQPQPIFLYPSIVR